MATIAQGQRLGSAPRNTSVTQNDILTYQSVGNQRLETITFKNLADALEEMVAITRDAVITSVNANYTMDGTEDLILADASGASFTITMPSVSSLDVGYTVRIKKIDSVSTTVTIQPAGGETIDLDTDASLAGIANPSITCVSDGTQWWLLNG